MKDPRSSRVPSPVAEPTLYRTWQLQAMRAVLCCPSLGMTTPECFQLSYDSLAFTKKWADNWLVAIPERADPVANEWKCIIDSIWCSQPGLRKQGPVEIEEPSWPSSCVQLEVCIQGTYPEVWMVYWRISYLIIPTFWKLEINTKGFCSVKKKRISQSLYAFFPRSTAAFILV